MKEIITVSMILFAVIDIIGSIPVLIQIRKQAGSIHCEKATLVSLGIMIMFLFIGESLLKFLGLDLSSFAIAGSLVLFFIALEMILGIRIHKDDMPATASIVPVAFPLIAGTGTMTTLLSLRAEYDSVTIIIGILLNLSVVYLCLRNLGFLERLLGPVGIGVVRKVFGFILLAIAVKIFRTHAGL
ncbi:MAG: MarC family protein [Bacteroidota bacterium]